MKKWKVEVAFAENFVAVDEWQSIDGMNPVDAETAEQAAEWAARTDGLETALFRVFELTTNEFGDMEKTGEPEYFNF